MNNQPIQALQSLISGGATAAASPSMAAADAKTKGKRNWGFSDGLYNHMLGLDKDGQKDFLQRFSLWNDGAWWDGKTWVDPNYKADPDKKTDDTDTDADVAWLDDVQNVRDNSVAGLSDAMKDNLGFGIVAPGMTKSTGLPTSGYTKYVGDPVVSKPKPKLNRPDESYGRPHQQQAQAAQGTGMSDMLAKLIGG